MQFQKIREGYYGLSKGKGKGKGAHREGGDSGRG